MDGDASLSGLLCLESKSFLKEKDELLVDENYIAVYDEECMQMLFDREMSFGLKKNEPLVFGNFFKYARLEAITWILKKREVFGFRFQTAYLSVIYFDKFLSKKSIDSEKSWTMQLLSMACLSLAAKMEEIKVPLLSELQTEEFNFESKVIQRMELLVLNTLEWRMSSITPFAFLPFFITRMSKKSPSDHFMSRTVQLILAIMREINLMEHRPSVIAAAATLRTLDQRLTRKTLECTMNSVSYCGFLEIEDVFTCYNLMQKLEIEIHNFPKSVNSPDISPTHLRAINVLDDSSSSAAVCTKRKRLTFNKSDNDHDIPNEKRLC
ncbi:cyclin-D5-1-like [Durio zibethinus]|uniref:Cyclin-D5-1-like n=1 Tax=Durio zibethinus TaxID=66656 RepID=A0A6P6ANK4_DURZI|nr:cyclin-D5-1-like [Durio zibethinus]